jgi:hypothetical protein
LQTGNSQEKKVKSKGKRSRIFDRITGYKVKGK